MELPIRLPRPAPLPGRFVDVASRLVAADERWLNGVTWEPWACRGLSAVEAVDCDTETLDAITTVCEAAVVQPPFQIIDAIKASTLEWTLDEVDALLGERFGLFRSAIFASELVTAAASGGSGLAGEAHAPTGAAFGSAATPIWNALAILEAELAEEIPGQRGIIHLPPGLLGQAVSNYGLRWDQDRWVTPLGHVVLADSGYVNMTEPTGQAASADGEDWVYASGPVAWIESEPVGLGVGIESIQVTRNTIHRWMSGYGLIVFDPCAVTAVLASYDVAEFPTP